MKTHLNELQLSNYLVGDLTARQARKVERHLKGCASCGRKYETMCAERDAFDASPQRAEELAGLPVQSEDRPFSTEPRRARSLQWAVVLPIAASLAVVVIGFAIMRGMDTESPSIRVKGNDSLVLFVKRGDRVQTLDDICHPGDAIRARFWTDKKYALIVGAEKNGDAVYPLYPEAGSVSAAVEQVPTETSGSWILDDTLGRQDFIAFFSDTPLALEEVLQSVEAALREGRPPIFEGAEISSFSCVKTRKRPQHRERLGTSEQPF